MSKQVANEMSRERVLLQAVANAALEHVEVRTPAAERLLCTALHDLDGFRKGRFIPFCDYNPALGERGVILGF